MPESVGGETVADQLRRALHWLVIATVVLYIALIGGAIYVYNIASKNTNGLCALKRQAEASVETSSRFLNDHPQGTKNFSTKLIKDSISRNQQIVDSLSNIECSPLPELTPETEETYLW